MATAWARSDRMRWTDEEIEILRKYWHKGIDVVAYRLNLRLPFRTQGAIKAKARALGLKGGADKEVAVDVPEHG